MLYVSLILEVLRARPALVFWTAALAQAATWALVPALFYAAPPGELATVIAVGHEFQLGTMLGPPLAFWAAEITYCALGIFGVYLLAQACVLTAYWAVFKLGIATVGARHAGLAILLMIGISAVTVPTPEFGPGVAAMPFWALTMLYYWRAVGEGRGEYWLASAATIGLLLLTSTTGAILVLLLALFTLAAPRGRAALATLDPWIAAVVALVVIFPYMAWFVSFNDIGQPLVERVRLPTSMAAGGFEWLRLIGLVLAAHAGFGLLILLAAGWPSGRHRAEVAIERPSVVPFARAFVYTFAFLPALAVTLVTLLLGHPAVPGGARSLVLLSGLAVIVAAGDSIRLHNQRVSAYAWFCLLVVPPAMTVLAILVLPWWGTFDLRVAQPADAMAKYFAETFERRTGTPLAFVAGETRVASLVALRSPSRPSLLLNVPPDRAPWTADEDVRRKGVVVVWQTTDVRGRPPPDIAARFPDLVPEVPRIFERPVQGLLPTLRIGWGVIRPQGQASTTSAAPPR